MDCSPPAPLSMESYRQEYWSGLPFPSLGDLPDPGIKTRSPALRVDSLPFEPPGKPMAQWQRSCLLMQECRRHRFNLWFGKIPWRRKWQPIPVFLPGKSHGQKSLVGYSPWDHRVGHDRATECVCACTHTHTQMHDQSTESRKLALCEDVRQGFTEM